MVKKNTLPQPRIKHLAWLLDLLPPIIARKEVRKILGGVVAPQSLCNDDNSDKGPRFRLYVGRDVVYRTPFLLEYLEERRGIREIDDSLRP